MVRSYAIANINPGEVRWEMAINLASFGHANVPIIGKISGPYLDVHRNDCVQAFLTDPDFASRDWLIFIDSDMEVSLSDCDTLVSVPDDVSIVTGIYANAFKTYGFRTLTFETVPTQPGDEDYDCRHWRMEPYEFKRLMDLQGHALAPHLKPVDGFGAGCLAIHRRVLTEFRDFFGPPMPWFYSVIVAKNQDDKPQWIGEDFGFGFRARQLGYTLYANTLVEIPHYKTLKIVPDPDKAFAQ